MQIREIFKFKEKTVEDMNMALGTTSITDFFAGSVLINGHLTIEQLKQLAQMVLQSTKEFGELISNESKNEKEPAI